MSVTGRLLLLGCLALGCASQREPQAQSDAANALHEADAVARAESFVRSSGEAAPEGMLIARACGVKAPPTGHRYWSVAFCYDPGRFAPNTPADHFRTRGRVVVVESGAQPFIVHQDFRLTAPGLTRLSGMDELEKRLSEPRADAH